VLPHTTRYRCKILIGTSVNVEGTRKLLSSRKSGVRRVVLALVLMYNADQSGLTSLKMPLLLVANFYASNKRLKPENLAREASRTLEVIIARPCLTYGLSQSSTYEAYFVRWTGLLLSHWYTKSCPEFSVGYQCFDHSYTCFTMEFSGQAYNIADSRARWNSLHS